MPTGSRRARPRTSDRRRPKAATRPNTATKVPDRLLRAAKRVDRARASLAAARKALARLADPEDYRLVSPPEWVRIQAALARQTPKLHQQDGVLGSGIGYRRVAGQETGEPCAIVVVDQKLSPRALRQAGRKPVPKHFVAPGGGRVEVDVVAVSGFRRLAHLGSSIGPNDVAEEGTLGAFARDVRTGQRVALTAMHVSGRADGEADDLGFVIPSLQDSSSPSRLGTFLDGTVQGVDAAAITLAPGVPAQDTIPGLGGVAGWRPIVFPGDRDIVVHFFGAASRFQSGTIVEPFVNLPRFGLQAAVLADVFAQPGDSGAGLVDNSRLLLGLLVAELLWDNRLVRVFSPMGLILRRLRCTIP